MGRLEDYKPVIAMVVLQFTYAALYLLSKAALLQGMSPKIFVVYRQAIATLVLSPVAYFSNRRKTIKCSMGLRSFCLIFVSSLIGMAINQNIYFEGLYLASSSAGTAMLNLVPGITFLIATIVGLEKVSITSLRSMAKVVGTVVCVGGAVSMALFRGPKLLNTAFPFHELTFHSGGENWLIGCLLLFGSSCCWSIWLILQVPIFASYPDLLSLTAWMCFLSTLQSAAIALFLEPDRSAWKLHSIFEISTCLYAGIIGSAFIFSVQSWCVSQRGPLFSAMFNPLCTLIVTIFACIFLHEELFTGSLAGSVAVVVGLYVVLWGKAKELEEIRGDEEPTENTTKTAITILIDESLMESGKINLQEPLLADKCCDVHESHKNY
ncbi:hypothetical protein NE237_024491 [Protea cynaroides]|uniref:WAT1-related protein n=1 Tax=Protea cynaroides TaxID=273540 RepID=A0A9Q0K0G4_9MAGN|nr:hypothetical protein NE237_024491 [Protea cynaroides]